jgi:hypothetical protein
MIADAWIIVPVGMPKDGKSLPNVGLTLQALSAQPLRGTAFYGVLWRKALGRIRSS